MIWAATFVYIKTVDSTFNRMYNTVNKSFTEGNNEFIKRT